MDIIKKKDKLMSAVMLCLFFESTCNVWLVGDILTSNNCTWTKDDDYNRFVCILFYFLQNVNCLERRSTS